MFTPGWFVCLTVSMVTTSKAAEKDYVTLLCLRPTIWIRDPCRTLNLISAIVCDNNCIHKGPVINYGEEGEGGGNKMGKTMVKKTLKTG